VIFPPHFGTDTADAVIVTESMAKQLADGPVAGLSFYTDSNKPKWNVVGVIPDFHFIQCMKPKNQ
jgi:putative ABC transport system permease protein